jgi:sialate O-acetylesterase
MRVLVSFDGQEKWAVVDEQGRWEILLDPMPAKAEGHELVARYDPLAPENSGYELSGLVAIEDVLVGDVWYCSGQSNMELGMGAIQDREAELEDSDYPLLRLYLHPKAASGVAQREPSGAWMVAERSTLLTGGWNGFSALAFCYGRALFKASGVPQGLIQAAYGGSPIDAWIPPEELRSRPGLSRFAAVYDKAERQWQEARRADPGAPHPWGAITDYAKLKPTSCYNAMLAPFAQMALRGVLWYQGESDVGRGELYALEMEALIDGMRRVFRNPGLYFYFVQVAPWNYGGNGQALPALWKAQYQAALIPGTGLALTSDLGDPADIHPRNKRPVAERLALWALRDIYGLGVDPEAPLLEGLERADDGGSLVLRIGHVQGGLATVDGLAPRGFFLAGPDGAAIPAIASITPSGKGIVIDMDGWEGPGSLRYAWNGLPDANLADERGMPLRPFEAVLP